jgi:hypothetical protein
MEQNQDIIKRGNALTLEHAIKNAADSVSLELSIAEIREIKAHIRDFMAQKFTTWILRSESKEGAGYQALFDAILESEKINE